MPLAYWVFLVVLVALGFVVGIIAYVRRRIRIARLEAERQQRLAQSLKRAEESFRSGAPDTSSSSPISSERPRLFPRPPWQR